MRPLIAGLSICLAVLAACGHDEEVLSPDTPTPTNVSVPSATPSPSTPYTTPSPTITSPPSPTPELDGFRELVGQIQAAFDARDADFFIRNAVFSSMECPNALNDCGLPYPTVIEGILVGLWYSEAAVEPIEDFRLTMERYTQLDPEIRAIAGIYEDRGGAIGGPAHYVVVTTPKHPYATAKALQFINDDGVWRFRLFLNTGRTAADNEWLTGDCAECYDYWEPW